MNPSQNNQVILIGNVRDTFDPNSLHYINGAAVLDVELSIPRPGTRKGPDAQAEDWVRFRFHDRQAEVMAQYAKVGTLMSIGGSLRIDRVEIDGKPRQKMFIKVHQFEFLGSKRAKQAG